MSNIIDVKVPLSIFKGRERISVKEFLGHATIELEKQTNNVNLSDTLCPSCDIYMEILSTEEFRTPERNTANKRTRLVCRKCYGTQTENKKIIKLD